MTELESDWFSLCEQAGIVAATGHSLLQTLFIGYHTPYRAYHNLNHIAACLQLAQPYLNQTTDPVAVQLAIWYHDLIYDTKASDNEHQSAQVAYQALQLAGVADDLVDEVSRLILTTQTHQAEADDRNAHLLLDVDLAILGAAAPLYQQYAQAIRQEYHWVSDEAYRQGRGRVLQQFLQRPRLYFTEPYTIQFEVQARTNIQQEIETLI